MINTATHSNRPSITSNTNQNTQSPLIARADVNQGRAFVHTSEQSNDIFSQSLNFVGKSMAESNSAYVKSKITQATQKNAQAGEDIPRHMHRFWAGGPLSQGSLRILDTAANKDRPGADQWKHTLWTSNQVNTSYDSDVDNKQAETSLRKSQFKTLQESMRYSIRNADDMLRMQPEELKLDATVAKKVEMAITTALGSAQTGVMENSWENVKNFSDLVRLLVLNMEGGMYIDVDMGIGNMDLDASIKHNDEASEVVLCGSLGAEYKPGENAVDEFNRNKERINQSSDHLNINEQTIYEKDADAIIQKAVDGSQMLNAELASKANNNKLQTAIEKLADKINQMGQAVTGMTVQQYLVDANNLHQSVPPYVLDIEHYTPESNNR